MRILICLLILNFNVFANDLSNIDLNQLEEQQGNIEKLQNQGEPEDKKNKIEDLEKIYFQESLLKSSKKRRVRSR